MDAVVIDGVSKRFNLHRATTKTLKERALSFRSDPAELFVALENVSFSVPQGQTLGLMGHNGSGKSTLLKCIAGTIRPSEGQIAVFGRMAAMLELGAGFHPDLTGRENVYLNGSILGFSKAHIDTIFDEILDFSELGQFIDSQVKYYSSGMYARLGFAVAVNLQPDVLLIDEVLSVGDESFQRKCLERIRQFQTEGRTIILVSHATGQVRQVCDRAVVLDHGSLIFDGKPDEAIAAYRRATSGESEAADAESEEAEKHSPVLLTGVSCEASDGSRTISVGESITIRADIFAEEPVEGVRVRLLLHSYDGIELINASTRDILGHDLDRFQGHEAVAFRIDDMPLTDGHYLVSIILQPSDEASTYDRSDQVTGFAVRPEGIRLGRINFALSAEVIAT